MVTETPDSSEAGGPPQDAGATFPVAGIGASAGGLEAIEALLHRLAPGGMAFIVLQHLAPGHESLLPEILSRAARLRVAIAKDRVALAPNTIYVAPPDADVTVEAGAIRVRQAAEHVPRESIDLLLRSMAIDLGAQAIGVLLSGAGSDGALGLRAIKEEGGITFAQDPRTASQPSMPQSAIDLGVADYCLSPHDIGDELMRLASHPFAALQRSARFLDQEALNRLFEMLRRAFGVDFSAYKHKTIERRLGRRMAVNKLDTLDAYLDLLDSHPRELAVLYADLLIGVTSFFRDREPFDALAHVVFPRLFENRLTDAPIRIWVPGCATGEEAYSVAICLLEFLDHVPGSPKVQIFATDIDDQALSRARLAVYPLSIEADVSPERLRRFFTRHDKGYEVARQVRDLVVFARHNLGKDAPFSRLDLISCRNVLIYMTATLQRRVLRLFHYALNAHGYLLLGTSESVGEASDQFSLVDRKLKIYCRKSRGSHTVFDFAHGTKPGGDERPAPAVAIERRPPISLQQLADRKVLEKFAPPGVLLDGNHDIVQFRGDTALYLAPSPGMATLNALKLVRPELVTELRATLQRVAETASPCVSEPVPLAGDAAPRSVVLDVTLLADGVQPRSYLVLFRLQEGAAEPARAAPIIVEPSDAAARARIQQLERELVMTKEYLQTLVQELETSNEELQSSNEELQSSNEEMQSTNEELETSTEELQSTNEELATVNEELENRMAQLDDANDDLANVLGCVSAPLVIVGLDLRIRVFSAAAERLLGLVAADTGRPIAYLGAALQAPQLEGGVSDTIKTIRERGQRIRGADGHWYTARIVPYRTSDHAIRGAVVEFLRAPLGRKGGEVPEVNELVAKVLSTLSHVVVLLDDQLRVVWVNRAFFDEFHFGAEILGRALDDLWPSRTAHPELWNALDATAMNGTPFADILVDQPFGRAGARAARFSARSLPGEGERPPLTLVTMEHGSEGRS